MEKRVLWLQTQSWHWASSFFGCTPVAQCIIFKKLSHVGMDYDPFRFFFCKGKSVICYVVPPFSRRATLRSPVHLLTRSPRVRCHYHHFVGVCLRSWNTFLECCPASEQAWLIPHLSQKASQAHLCDDKNFRDGLRSCLLGWVIVQRSNLSVFSSE